ncbi:hypothetical protein TELCIR_10726 [Teladorsagia circumcincta]|uniref:Uncharacterized protein n=1 Tax=Teladorsagia circumcincta TaxID=45464 RepID=A0A2G9UBA4_TELCI|nr:hypothetical protein TELCIR_10726 [Teladorsagia circumcincta]
MICSHLGCEEAQPMQEKRSQLAVGTLAVEKSDVDRREIMYTTALLMIVLLGYSLGTAAVTDLAASDPEGVVGVVLVAPFTSGIRLFINQPGRTESSKLDRFLTFLANETDAIITNTNVTSEGISKSEEQSQ